jgi:hypothetical protein
MSIYQISDSSKNNFNYPSDLRPKYRNRKKQEISISALGSISLSLPFYIKNARAEHGSIAGEDISINGIYYNKSTKLSFNPENIDPSEDIFVYDDLSEESFSILKENIGVSNLPFIDQGTFPICSLLPTIHMIQSQLDIYIDYTKLLKCLSSDPKTISWRDMPTVAESFTIINLPKSDPDKIYYYKMLNLLFISQCLPVSEFCYKDDKFQEIDNYIGECDDSCADRYIALKGLSLLKPSAYLGKPNISDKAICEIINSGLPFSLGLNKIWTKKFILRTLLGKNWNQGMSIPPTEAEIDEKLREQNVSDVDSSHSVTAISCAGPDDKGCYVFGILNSWEISKNKIIQVKSCNSSIKKILDPDSITSTGSFEISDLVSRLSIRECRERPKKDPSCECSTPTPLLGACCLGDDCIETTSEDCFNNRGGVVWVPDIECPGPCVVSTPTPTPTPLLGACCTGDDCVQTTSEDCFNNQGGVAWVPDTECPGPCIISTPTPS